jgi:hypothetical protein
MSAMMSLVTLAASVSLVIWSTAIRRDMERSGFLRGAGLMPAGATQEVH